LSLAFFVLGALLILLGLTTGFEVPGLKQLVPEPSFRWISVVCGVLSVLIAIPIVYRPPAEPKIERDSETLAVPDDLRKSFAARRDAFGYGSRLVQILDFVISQANRDGLISLETVGQKFNQLPGSKVYYRLECLRLLCFIEKAGKNVYRLSKAYELESQARNRPFPPS
jgi:hypothetical protein